MSENWQFYAARVDDQPASIFVDVGLDAPVAGFGDMAWLRLYMRAPRPDGLSNQAEYDTLIALEDAVTTAITAGGDAIYVGRKTSAGVRDFYFYTRGGGFAERVAAAMAVWPDYAHENGHRPDEAWTTYRNFLYPTEADFQRIGNRDVIRQLVVDGDDPEQPRSIHHWAYFPTEAGRAAFASGLAGQRYLIAPFEKPRDGRFPVRFERVDVPNRLDDVTIALHRAATELDGDYDGWECEVIGSGIAGQL